MPIRARPDPPARTSDRHLSQRVNPVVRKRLGTEVPLQVPPNDVVDAAHRPALYSLSSVTPHARGLVNRQAPLLAPHHLITSTRETPALTGPPCPVGGRRSQGYVASVPRCG